METIASLLDGPTAPAPEAVAPPVPVPASASIADPRRGTRRGPLPPLDSRADWYGDLRHEAARHDRYGRPVAVAAVEVVPVTRDGLPPARVVLDGLLGQVGSLLRANCRAADRVVRVGTVRFNVLLPETGWDEARAFAERVSELAGRGIMRGTVRVRLRIALGVPGTGESLEETLALTEAALLR